MRVFAVFAENLILTITSIHLLLDVCNVRCFTATQRLVADEYPTSDHKPKIYGRLESIWTSAIKKQYRIDMPQLC